ncbi:MAG: transporter [Candidatus Acidiferrales bacterium]
MPSKLRRLPVLVLLLVSATLQPIRAETPFLVEDPSTLPTGRWESFTNYERFANAQGKTTSFPQVEFHVGVGKFVLLHINLPYQNFGNGSDSQSGLGDSNFGLKYQFAHGQGNGLTAAFFPQMTIPTGNSSNGLGAGKPTYELPLWVQRTARGLTICFGGGLSINPVPGGRTSRFAGILAHRDIGRFLVGTEILVKGAESDDAVATTTVNIGTNYHLSSNLGFLVRIGRTVSDQRTNNIYLAIYRAWGTPPADETPK